MSRVDHELSPIYDEESKALILGTIPSPKSREDGFYYAHPRNRFWMVLSDLYNIPLNTIEEKKNFLYKNHIALWDVLASCTIEGASDSSIHDMRFNKIEDLLLKTQIDTIFCTGKKAYTLYQKNIYPKTKIEAICLPSTSPANCAVKYDVLRKEYAQIKKHCFF